MVFVKIKNLILIVLYRNRHDKFKSEKTPDVNGKNSEFVLEYPTGLFLLMIFLGIDIALLLTIMHLLRSKNKKYMEGDSL